MNIFELVGKISVQGATEAKSAISDISQTAGNMASNIGGKMQAVGGTMQAVGKKIMPVSAAVGGIGLAAVKTTADFDASMSKVAAVSGATGKDFDALRAKAREMGSKTKFSASEAADAMNYMAMAGWKTGDMLNGVEGIMNLAAASGEDLATTSDIVTDALTAFGLSADDSGHFADVLAAASSNANTNVSMLGESFKYAAPVAGALGISAEDTSVALGLMANAGIKASQSGTSLRTGLTNLAKPTDQMLKYMNQYGVHLVKNSDGTINLRDTMTNMRDTLGGLSNDEQAAAASAIFGKNAMAGWLAIINASDKDFDKLTGAIDNCDGTAQSMAETMQDNLPGQLTILKSQIEELSIGIGDALVPDIRKGVKVVQDIVDKFNSMDDSTKATIARIGVVVAAVGPALLIGGKVVSTVGSVVSAIGGMGSTLSAIPGVLGAIGAPVLAVIAIIAALAAAVIYLWNTNEEFRNNVLQVWEAIKGLISAAIEAIKTVIQNFVTIAKALWAQWGDSIKATASAIWGSISGIINGAMTVILGIIKAITALIKGDWKGFWDAIKTIASGVLNALKNFVQLQLTAIKAIFSVIFNAIKAVVSAIFKAIYNVTVSQINAVRNFISNGLNAAKNIVSNVLNSIKEKFRSIFESAKNIVKNAIDKIKGFFKFNWELPKIKLPHFSISGKFSLNPPSIPHFGVDWYRDAVMDPILMKSPTVFGINPQTGNLKAGGEAGEEITGGSNRIMQMISSAASQGNDALLAALERILQRLEHIEDNLYDNMVKALQTMGVEFDERELARLVRKYA